MLEAKISGLKLCLHFTPTGPQVHIRLICALALCRTYCPANIGLCVALLSFSDAATQYIWKTAGLLGQYLNDLNQLQWTMPPHVFVGLIFHASRMGKLLCYPSSAYDPFFFPRYSHGPWGAHVHVLFEKNLILSYLNPQHLCFICSNYRLKFCCLVWTSAGAKASHSV